MSKSSSCGRVMRTCFYLLFLLVPLVLTPWNYELFEYNKMLVTYGLSAIIVTAWFIRIVEEKEIRVPKTPFDIPIWLFVLSQFVATLFSMDGHVSWFGYYSRFNGGMVSILTYVALYYAFVTAFSPSNSSDLPKNSNTSHKGTLLTFLLGTGAVVALYGVAEHFGIDKNLWVQDVQTRVFSTLGQPNWLAAYLVALIPVTITMSFKYHATSMKSILWSTLALVFFITLLFTRSRSGLLAFGVTQLIFLLLFFRPRIGKSPERFISQMKRLGKIIKTTDRLRYMTIMYVCMAVILFFNGTHTMTWVDRYFSFEGWKTIVTNQMSKTKNQHTISNQSTDANKEKTPQTITGTPNDATTSQTTGPSLETGGTESGVIRKYVWQGAINAWRSSIKTLLVGTGTETFAFAFYEFKPVGHNLTSEWDFLYNKAHNEYLNYLATTGVFGLGTYIFFIGSVIFFVYKKVSRSFSDGHTEDKFTFIALFVGWLSILITNFFGFAVVIIQILFFLIPASLILLTKEETWTVRSFSLSEKAKRRNTIIAVIIGSLILLSLIVCWFADAAFATGYHLSRAGKIGSSYTNITRAVTLNPLEPMYHDERGNTLSMMALATQENGDATSAAALSQAAIAESDIAIKVSPNNINFWKTRTKILFTLSGIDENFLPSARDALLRAQTLSPSDPKISYNLAIIEGRLGNVGKAIESLDTTIELKPNYRDGYYALSVFYTETGNTEKAKEILRTYLTQVDSSDEQFQKLIAE